MVVGDFVRFHLLDVKAMIIEVSFIPKIIYQKEKTLYAVSYFLNGDRKVAYGVIPEELEAWTDSNTAVCSNCRSRGEKEEKKEN